MKRRIFTSIATLTVVTALAVVGGATVADNYVDGHRAVLEWETDYGSSGECHDANGAANGYVWLPAFSARPCVAGPCAGLAASLVA